MKKYLMAITFVSTMVLLFGNSASSEDRYFTRSQANYKDCETLTTIDRMGTDDPFHYLNCDRKAGVYLHVHWNKSNGRTTYPSIYLYGIPTLVRWDACRGDKCWPVSVKFSHEQRGKNIYAYNFLKETRLLLDYQGEFIQRALKEDFVLFGIAGKIYKVSLHGFNAAWEDLFAREQIEDESPVFQR